MSFLLQARAYLKHYFTAKRRGHGVHSPFVYQLARDIFPKKTIDNNHPAELWRSTCLQNKESIAVTDFGTGTSGPRQVSDLAKRAAKKPQQGALLGRLVAQHKPAYLLELGTSLGITTLYEAQAGQKQFITLEGCPETARMAEAAFKKHHTAVEIVTGNFDVTLTETLKRFPQLDYVYIDGNHRKEPTLKYFEQCLPFMHNNSVIVFDDIHWSEEMEQAWEIIKKHHKVRVSIDLFHFGIVYFRDEQLREDFVLFT